MTAKTAKTFDPFKLFRFEFNDDGMFSSCLIPKRIETCGCCGKRLTLHCEGWDQNDGETIWWPADIQVECVDDLECYKRHENSEYWRMPYVYHLPVVEHCKRWLTQMLEVYYGIRPIPKKWLEKNGQLRLPYMEK